jgi:hypothetical protein
VPEDNEFYALLPFPGFTLGQLMYIASMYCCSDRERACEGFSTEIVPVCKDKMDLNTLITVTTSVGFGQAEQPCVIMPLLLPSVFGEVGIELTNKTLDTDGQPLEGFCETEIVPLFGIKVEVFYDIFSDDCCNGYEYAPCQDVPEKENVLSAASNIAPIYAFAFVLTFFSMLAMGFE